MVVTAIGAAASADVVITSVTTGGRAGTTSTARGAVASAEVVITSAVTITAGCAGSSATSCTARAASVAVVSTRTRGAG